MQTEYLYEFTEVARRLNFTSAAKALHVTQPTLSNHMRSLESELGVALIVRATGEERAHLTEAGRYFYEQAERMVALLDEMREGVRRVEARHVESFSVLMPSPEYASFLMDRVARFKRERTDVEIRPVHGGDGDPLARLIAGDVDIACVDACFDLPGTADRVSGIALAPCTRVEMGLWVDAENPIAKNGPLPVSALDGLTVTFPSSGPHGLLAASAASFMERHGVRFGVVERYCDSLEDFFFNRVSPDDVVPVETCCAASPALLMHKDRVVVRFEPEQTADYAVAYRDEKTAPCVEAFIQFLRRSYEADGTVRFFPQTPMA